MSDKVSKKEREAQEAVERTAKKTYTLMGIYLLVFGIPAIIGALLGNFIDERFEIAPFGTLAIFALSYTISWFIAFRATSEINSKFSKKLEVTEEIDE